MRSFSALNRYCGYEELVALTYEKGYAVRVAGEAGDELHAAIQNWIRGDEVRFSDRKWPKIIGSASPADWFRRMTTVWSPPAGCMAEVAIGLDADGRAHEVNEPRPHDYVPRDPSVTLVTAGRLDVLYFEDGGETLVIADTKSGRKFLGDPWEIPQLVAQAVAALAMAKRSGQSVKRVKLGPYYARLGLFHFETRHAEVVEKLFIDVLHWATMDTSPNQGPWCLSCHSAKHCDANPEKYFEAA